MKLFALMLMSFISFSALADRQAFIVKSSSTGFGPIEWVRSEKCEVFDTEVILTRSYARSTVNYQIPFSSDDSLNELIDLARQERLRMDDNYMCDGPSTVIKARFVREGAEAEEVLLYSTGGCGSPKKVRQGPNSSALMDIASTFCPTTH